MLRMCAHKVFRRSKRSDSTVVKCCPRSGLLTIKDYISSYFMTKLDAISDTGDFYLHKRCLIFTKYHEKPEYVTFLNFGLLIKAIRSTNHFPAQKRKGSINDTDILM